MSTTQILEVWGELACFTRPELKVERFSYPVITPSAARGIFDAIYCKPQEFRWQIIKIEILSPPSYIALRRNEVKEKVNVNTLNKWMSGSKEVEPIWADEAATDDATRGRTQRQTMALRNVHYRLHARIIPWRGHENELAAFEAQFRRRAATGKCIYQPYFGCREFPAYFELVESDSALPEPADVTLGDLGLMLYDVFDLSQPRGPLREGETPSISVFRPKVEHGVMMVPPYEDPAVIKVPKEVV